MNANWDLNTALAGLLSRVPGTPTAIRVAADGHCLLDAARPRAVLPGAFNPLHDGHRRLAGEAARRLGCPVDFELSVLHVDKGALDLPQLLDRLSQFTGGAGVWVTRAPTFVQKAELFPGATFVVGADTAERVLAPRYHGDGEVGVIAALERLRLLGVRILVACRTLPTGKCLGLEDLTVPEAGRSLFVGIPREEFRVDLSSTELRATIQL